MRCHWLTRTDKSVHNYLQNLVTGLTEGFRRGLRVTCRCRSSATHFVQFFLLFASSARQMERGVKLDLIGDCGDSHLISSHLVSSDGSHLGSSLCLLDYWRLSSDVIIILIFSPRRVHPRPPNKRLGYWPWAAWRVGAGGDKETMASGAAAAAATVRNFIWWPRPPEAAAAKNEWECDVVGECWEISPRLWGEKTP